MASLLLVADLLPVLLAPPMVVAPVVAEAGADWLFGPLVLDLVLFPFGEEVVVVAVGDA